MSVRFSSRNSSCLLDVAGHQEKIYFVKFHPLASNVLASASYDMTVIIWDLINETGRIQLTGHKDTVIFFV